MKNKLLIVSLIYFYSVGISFTQHYDYLWHLGQDSQDNIEHAGMILDFFDDTLTIHTEIRETYFRQANTSMCDSFGNVLFYSNGIHIANSLGGIMENGDYLNPGYFGDSWHEENVGYILDQGLIALPFPEEDSLFLLLHLDRMLGPDLISTWSQHFYFSLIDLRQNNGLGRIEAKNQVLLDEMLALGKLSVVRHANGRDWWILVRKFDSNEYHNFIVTNQGVNFKETFMVGDSIPSPGVGQAVFSPDGSKYAYLNLVDGVGTDDYIAIYDFDRCTGLLYNPIQFTYSDSAWTGGLAISPNSRYLYVSSYLNIYQYDLWANDIEASRDTVAEWDGFTDGDFLATTFYLAQLGPNGKIYINSGNGTRYLHVINSPDLPGDSCDVCQHCIELPGYNSFSMPNFPNYRLGHLEGSSCDTLREPPIAAFEYQPASLEINFTNKSQHDIRSWYWTFGDTHTDTLVNPIHEYEEEGVYEVCLTSTNPRGADTFCQEIAIFVDNVNEPNDNGIKVFPNPAKEVFVVDLGNYSPQDAILRLFTTSGQEIGRFDLDHQQKVIAIADLVSGIYFYEIMERGTTLGRGKLLKM